MSQKRPHSTRNTYANLEWNNRRRHGGWRALRPASGEGMARAAALPGAARSPGRRPASTERPADPPPAAAGRRREAGQRVAAHRVHKPEPRGGPVLGGDRRPQGRFKACPKGTRFDAVSAAEGTRPRYMGGCRRTPSSAGEARPAPTSTTSLRPTPASRESSVGDAPRPLRSRRPTPSCSPRTSSGSAGIFTPRLSTRWSALLPIRGCGPSSPTG